MATRPLAVPYAIPDLPIEANFQAIQAWGNSVSTGVENAGTPEGAPPTVPALDPPGDGTLTLTFALELNSRTDSYAAQLGWGAVTDAAAYVLEFSEVGATGVYRQQLNALSVRLAGMFASRSYQFRVATVDKYRRQGAWSGYKTESTPADTQGPPKTVGVTVYAGIHSLIIQWTASTAADLSHYEVQISNQANFSNIIATQIEAGPISLFVPGANNSGTYYVRVRGIDFTNNPGDYSWMTAADNPPASGTTGQALNIDIAPNAVDTAQLAASAVTTSKIGTGQVATTNIANAAITNAKIGALAVDTANIALLAVDSAQIKSAAITNAKIGNLAVQTAQMDVVQINTAQVLTIIAGNILTGTLTAVVTLSGTIRTALSGKRTVIDPAGVRLYPQTGDELFNLDIAGEKFTLRSATSGKRIQLDATNGLQSFVQDDTGGGFVFEDLTAGMRFYRGSETYSFARNIGYSQQRATNNFDLRNTIQAVMKDSVYSVGIASATIQAYQGNNTTNLLVADVFSAYDYQAGSIDKAISKMRSYKKLTTTTIGEKAFVQTLVDVTATEATASLGSRAFSQTTDAENMSRMKFSNSDIMDLSLSDLATSSGATCRVEAIMRDTVADGRFWQTVVRGRSGATESVLATDYTQNRQDVLSHEHDVYRTRLGAAKIRAFSKTEWDNTSSSSKISGFVYSQSSTNLGFYQIGSPDSDTGNQYFQISLMRRTGQTGGTANFYLDNDYGQIINAGDATHEGGQFAYDRDLRTLFIRQSSNGGSTSTNGIEITGSSTDANRKVDIVVAGSVLARASRPSGYPCLKVESLAINYISGTFGAIAAGSFVDLDFNFPTGINTGAGADGMYPFAVVQQSTNAGDLVCSVKRFNNGGTQWRVTVRNIGGSTSAAAQVLIYLVRAGSAA